jgi:hypothetical protein
MEENIYQNIDLTNNNPLKPEAKIELSFVQKLKTDLKIQVLVGLSTFTVLILFSSIIISLTRSPAKRNPLGNNLPTPIATPTYINQANILPAQYQTQFTVIENKINYNPEIIPPEIDLNVGY